MPACMHHPSSVAHPDCSRPAGLKPTRVLPHYSTPPHPALATRGCLHRIQVTGTGLPCCERLRPNLHPPAGPLLSLSIGSLLPHHKGNPAATQNNLDCLGSWLHNGGIISPLTSGQRQTCPFLVSILNCILSHEQWAVLRK